MFRDVREKAGAALCLERMATLAIALSDAERAAFLLGAAEVLRERLHYPLHPSEMGEQQRRISAGAAQLSEPAWESAWLAGRTATLDEAIDLALTAPTPPVESETAPRGPVAPTASNTPTVTPTASNTPTVTPTPTLTPTATSMATATATPTPTVGGVLPTTLGLTSVGSVADTGSPNYMNGSRFVCLGLRGRDRRAPRNQFSLAIYSDAGGKPGSLLAQTAAGTLEANSWNTLPITASLNANTAYWVFYNTNGSTAAVNNLYYDDDPNQVGAYRARTFGTWPTSFGAPTPGGWRYSIYVSGSL